MKNNCTPEQLAWLRRHRTLKRKAMHAAFVARFGDIVSCDSLRRVCQRRGWLTGRKRRVATDGTERIDRDGYRRVKVQGVHGWALKHRLEWEKLHGPVPRDKRLKCVGDKANSDPSNWRLVPAGTMRRYNKFGRFEELPSELKPTVLMIGLLEHRLAKEKDRAPAT